MKKDLSKNNKKTHTDDEVKSYLGVLSEQHTHEFKILKEGIKGLNQRFDRVDSDIQEIKDDLNKKVDRYEFVSLDKRVSVVEKKVLK